MDVRIIAVPVARLICSLLLIVHFSRRLSANIDIITDGLSTLAQKRLPDCLNSPASWDKSAVASMRWRKRYEKPKPLTI